MNEIKKLEEAKYFFTQMTDHQQNRNIFIHNLSAFLSAARSVLQYAKDEAKSKPGGQNWYDNLMKSGPELKFFKDKRDLNIHDKPVHTKANYILHAETGGYLLSFGSVSMTVYDKDGNVKQQVQSDPDAPKVTSAQNTNPIPNEVKYYFDNWAGSEDVLVLCQKYVQELENVVNNGISNGFITG
jgi:hypothetical protein